MSELRFTSIKLPEKGVYLEFEVGAPGNSISSKMTSDDPPGVEFEAAMSAWKPEVIRLTGLPKNYCADVSVRKIGISYKGDRRIISINALKQLEDFNTPWNLNLPPIGEPDEDNGKTEGRMTPRQVKLLNDLIEHATLFVKGHRTQVELFDERARRGEGPREITPIERLALEAEAKRVEAVKQLRIRQALLEIKPAQLERVAISDSDLLRAIADRWDDIEYFDPDAQLPKDRKYHGVHKLYFNDQHGAGVIWVAVEVREPDEFDINIGQPDVKLRYYHDIQPDVFDASVTLATLVAPELVEIYRDMLVLPTPEEAADNPLLLADPATVDALHTCVAEIVGSGMVAPSGSIIQDADLEQLVAARLLEVAEMEAEIQEGEALPAGYLRQTTQGGVPVTNFVRAEPAPAFYYGVDPKHPLVDGEPEAVLKLEGLPLVNLVRELTQLRRSPDEPHAQDGISPAEELAIDPGPGAGEALDAEQRALPPVEDAEPAEVGAD